MGMEVCGTKTAETASCRFMPAPNGSSAATNAARCRVYFCTNAARRRVYVGNHAAGRRVYVGNHAAGRRVYVGCQPRGAIMVVVLVCLMVAVGMSAAVLRQIAAERLVVQSSQRSLQASWLAEAGIERAAAKLAADATYTGETWAISAKELGVDDAATVKIHIEAIANHPGRRSIRVEADYGDTPGRRCRQVKQIAMDREAIQSH